MVPKASTPYNSTIINSTRSCLLLALPPVSAQSAAVVVPTCDKEYSTCAKKKNLDSFIQKEKGM